jgi:hypothetical protein
MYMKDRLAWTGWILLLFLIVSQVSSQRAPAPAAIDTWEYKYFNLTYGRGTYTQPLNIAEMNKLGAEGGELATHQPENNDSRETFIFKRKK